MKTAFPHFLTQLKGKDPKLEALIERVGPPDVSRTPGEPFDALLRSIVYQQLTGKAAGSIMKRVLELVPKAERKNPRAYLKLDDEVLRGAGLSRAKTKYVRALCEAAVGKRVPTRVAARKMGDDELIALLTEINGIGKWSVEMLLIFNLGRLDVLPATDYGVRKGFAMTFGKKTKKGELVLPTPKEVLAYGERWRPYRTIPSWYMWRATELD